MKKILSLTIAVIISFTLISCTEKTENAENSTTTNTEQNSSEEKTATVESVDKAKAESLIKEGAILLDVRTQGEYNAQHIEGAELLPYDEVQAKAEEKYPDKKKTIIVYCRSGRRSGIAANTLINLGYKKVYDLGPISAWY